MDNSSVAKEIKDSNIACLFFPFDIKISGWPDHWKHFKSKERMTEE